MHVTCLVMDGEKKKNGIMGRKVVICVNEKLVGERLH